MYVNSLYIYNIYNTYDFQLKYKILCFFSKLLLYSRMVLVISPMQNRNEHSGVKRYSQWPEAAYNSTYIVRSIYSLFDLSPLLNILQNNPCIYPTHLKNSSLMYSGRWRGFSHMRAILLIEHQTSSLSLHRQSGDETGHKRTGQQIFDSWKVWSCEEVSGAGRLLLVEL